MEDLPTPESGDASPIDRIEALLSADDAPENDQPQAEAPKADVPATGEPQGDQPEPDVETAEYQLSDMAKLLGTDESTLDVDEDGSLLVKTKVDGVEGKAKFTDLVKSYQLQKHVDQQVREAAEARKALQEQERALYQQNEIQQAIIGKIAEIKAVEAEYQQYRSINMDQLIDTDPHQALKVQRHMQALQERHASLTNEANQAANYVQSQRAQQSTASLQQEAQALIRALPEWADSTRAESERNAIKADLKSRGYTDRDIDSLMDHKAVLLARDAMLYRQLKAGTPATEKQVRSAPKIIKPGSTQAVNKDAKAVRELKSAVRQTGSKQSVMDYLLATGKV